jgi:DNA-binding response OmpR family regulator
MLTAFPLPGSEGEEGADKLLVKPMNTSDLLRQLEALLVTHEDNKRKNENSGPQTSSAKAARKTASGSAMRKPAVNAVSQEKTVRKNPGVKLAEAH